MLGRQRLVYTYPWQEADGIEVYSDTDWSGCARTRRSTSGGCTLVNGYLVKHWSKTQSTVCLSSGEAELGGICAGVAQAIGLQSVCADLGFHYKIRVWSDATAAIGIARRRGMGKIRHLVVTDLWCQQKVRSGAVQLVKVLGADNPADLMTKYTPRDVLEKALATMNMVTKEGRAEVAPAAAGC